jgi:hypothetical protein
MKAPRIGRSALRAVSTIVPARGSKQERSHGSRVE